MPYGHQGMAGTNSTYRAGFDQGVRMLAENGMKVGFFSPQTAFRLMIRRV